MFTVRSQNFKVCFKLCCYDADILKGTSPRRGARDFFLFSFFLSLSINPPLQKIWGGGFTLLLRHLVRHMPAAEKRSDSYRIVAAADPDISVLDSCFNMRGKKLIVGSSQNS